MTKPISPNDFSETLTSLVPEEVIHEFNKAIVQGHGVVLQDVVVRAICERMKVSESEVFERHWLDVEEIYRQAGWDVVYSKPGFNEDFAAYFTFSRPRKLSCHIVR